MMVQYNTSTRGPSCYNQSTGMSNNPLYYSNHQSAPFMRARPEAAAYRPPSECGTQYKPPAPLFHTPLHPEEPPPYEPDRLGFSTVMAGTQSLCGLPFAPPATRSVNEPRAPLPPLEDDGPLAFRPVELPVPCAYIKLPWPPTRKMARLVPPMRVRPPPNCKDASSVVAPNLFRSYVKRMVVEEVCVDPAAFLLRYCHYASQLLYGNDLFDKCRLIAPAIQMMSLQHQLARFDGTKGDTLANTSINVLNHVSAGSSASGVTEKIFAVHHLLERWSSLPIAYRKLEKLWVTKIVPRVSQYFSELEDLADNPEMRGTAAAVLPQLTHLVIVLDCSVHNTSWESHCMRLLVHLIAQIIAVASSTLPLYLQRDNIKQSSSPNGFQLYEGFQSCQVVVLPPSAFDHSVSRIRSASETGSMTEPVKKPSQAYSSLAETSSIAAFSGVERQRHQDLTSVVSTAKGGKIIMGTATAAPKRSIFCWPNDNSSKSVDNVVGSKPPQGKLSQDRTFERIF